MTISEDESDKRFKPGSPNKGTEVAAVVSGKPKRELRRRRKAALGRSESETAAVDLRSEACGGL